MNHAKQGSQETLQAFSERCLNYAEDAFGDSINDKIAQDIIIGTYKDGIADVQMRDHPIRRDRKTFQAAREESLSEQSHQHRVKVRRWQPREEVEMDVSALDIRNTSRDQDSAGGGSATPQPTGHPANRAARLDQLEGKVEGMVTMLQMKQPDKQTQGDTKQSSPT